MCNVQLNQNRQVICLQLRGYPSWKDSENNGKAFQKLDSESKKYEEINASSPLLRTLIILNTFSVFIWFRILLSLKLHTFFTMEAETADANGSKETESVEVKEKDKPQPLQVSVTEKVIFCIDATIFSCSGDDDKMFDEFHDILLLYMKMKKRISTKNVDFKCLLCSSGKITPVEIRERKDLQSALLSLRSEKETGEFDLSLLFNSLARTIELPHPELCNEMIPPPLVYHCLLIFGHNIHIPVMKDTNAFDFLVQNPFFSCDTIYIYNNSFEGNNCEEIGSALHSMYEVLNGYFLTVNCQDFDKQYSVFAQLLGHPLIRPPQNHAKFDLKALIAQENVK